MSNILIPQNTTYIDRCYYENRNIIELKIPETVTVIGDSSFSSNYIEKIDIPHNVRWTNLNPKEH